MTQGPESPSAAPVGSPDRAAERAAKPAGKIAAAKSGVTHARSRAQDAFDRLEASRRTNHVVDTGFHFYERDLNAGGGVLAGALAFRLFLFAIPYAFVVITLFGSFADMQEESGQDAARSAGLTGLIGKSIADAQRQTDGTKILSVVVGVVALVLAARAVVKTLRAVHALAWRVRLTRLPHSSRAAGALIGLVFLTSVIATGASKVRAENPALGLLVTLVTVVVWAGAWLWVSWHLPHEEDAPWTAFIPGAVLFALIMQAMHLLTVLYFARKVSHASDTYGAIGSAIGILLALYLFGRVMSASAVLNATLWERRKREQATRVV